jgi:hypothetical protein
MARINENRSPSVKTSRPEPKSKAPSSSPSKPATKPSTPPKQAKDGFDSGKKPAGPQPTNTVNSKAIQSFNSGAKNDIQRFATDSKKATGTVNKDGSVTRTSTSTSGNTTRTQELTTSKGKLGESNLKYATTSQTGGASIKNTYTAKTDVLGRPTASHEREAVYQHGDRTKTKTTNETTDHWGFNKRSETESTKIANGDNSTTTSKTHIKDSLGNEFDSKSKETVTKNGNTTVTQTQQSSKGKELTTNSSATYENGKLSISDSVDYKNTKFNNQKTYLRETEVKPSTQDSGFTQKSANDKLGIAQHGGDLLAGMGAKKEWKYEVPPEKMKENNILGNNPNSFVGTRNGYTGSQTFSVGADGVNATFNREAKIGAYAETKGSTTGKYGTASYDAYAKAEAKASVDAQGKLNANGLDASLNAKIGVSVEAQIHGKAETNSVKIGGVDVKASAEGTVRASAEASAEATGNVKVTRNPPTAIAEGTVGASAVAKIEGKVSASAGPFTINASAYASAGAEAKASGVIGYQDGKIKIGGSLGAALGVGAGGSVNVEVDVKQIGEMAKNTAVAAADVNHDGKLGLDDAKAAVNNAANTVKSWLHW